MKYIKEMLLVKNRITINEFLNNYPNFNDKSKNKDGFYYYQEKNKEIISNKILSKIEDKIFYIINKYNIYYDLTEWHGIKKGKDMLLKFKSKSNFSYDFYIDFHMYDDYYFISLKAFYNCDFDDIFYYKFDGLKEFISFIKKLIEFIYK